MATYPNRDRALKQLDRHGAGTPNPATPQPMTAERYAAAFREMGLMLHQQWQAEMAQLPETLARLARTTYRIGPRRA